MGLWVNYVIFFIVSFISCEMGILFVLIIIRKVFDIVGYESSEGLIFFI